MSEERVDRKMDNSRCNCCEKGHGNWGWGQNQDKCKGHDNSKKNVCKCCWCCWEDKEECDLGKEKEKEFPKCGCMHGKHSQKNCGCGLEDKGKDFYGYESTGKDSYYGW